MRKHRLKHIRPSPPQRARLVLSVRRVRLLLVCVNPLYTAYYLIQMTTCLAKKHKTASSSEHKLSSGTKGSKSSTTGDGATAAPCGRLFIRFTLCHSYSLMTYLLKQVRKARVKLSQSPLQREVRAPLLPILRRLLLRASASPHFPIFHLIEIPTK